MYSMTKHQDNLCLTDDDLEGLNYLYPTCFWEVETDAGTVPDQGMPYKQPQCVEPERKSVSHHNVDLSIRPWIRPPHPPLLARHRDGFV